MADESKPTTEAQPANTGTDTASTVKDVAAKASDKAGDLSANVFSMFGGGPKKEATKDNVEDNDRSGSAKAKAGEEDEDVSGFYR